MSVQTEINRIESAKTAIATAIAGKGVTVPSGTKIDGMAALIEGIEAGGGGGTSVETCTVNISSTSYDGSSTMFEVVYLTVENDSITQATGSVPAEGFGEFTVLKNSLMTFQLPLIGGAGSFDEIVVNEGDSELAYLNEEANTVVHIGNDDVHEIIVYGIASGAGTGGTSVETCTVKLTSSASSYVASRATYTSIDANGNLVAKCAEVSGTSFIIENVVCGTAMCLYYQRNAGSQGYTFTNCMLMWMGSNYHVAVAITASRGETAIINSAFSAAGGSG